MDKSLQLWWFNLSQAPRLLNHLVQKFGAGGTLRVLFEAVKISLSNPFESLEPVVKADGNARLSLEQFGPLYVLYRALRAAGTDRARALEFLAAFSREVATDFLRQSIPRLAGGALRAMSRGKRHNLVEQTVSAFFNARAEIRWEADDNGFALPVSFCWFAYFSRELDAPELAPLFCAADRAYFERQQPGIEFGRDQTLATGAPYCDFRFRLRPATESPANTSKPG